MGAQARQFLGRSVRRHEGSACRVAVIKDVSPISDFLESGAEPADAGRQLYAVLAQRTVMVRKRGEC